MADALGALREQYPEYYDMFLSENNIGQSELEAMTTESGRNRLADFAANLQKYARQKERENATAEAVLTSTAEAEVVRNFDEESTPAPAAESTPTERQSEAAEDPFYWDNFARPNDAEITRRLNEIAKMQQTEEFKDYTFSYEYAENNSKISNDFTDIINYGAARNLAAKSDTPISPLAFNNERKLEKQRIETEYYTALHQLSHSGGNRHSGFHDILSTVAGVNRMVYLDFSENEIIDYLDTANTLARNMGVDAGSPQVANGLKSLRRAARRSVIASNAGMMRRWYDKPAIAKSFHYAGKFIDSLQKIENSNAFVASLANLKLSGNPAFIAYRSILSTRAIYNDVKNFQDYSAFKNAFINDNIKSMGWQRYQSIEGGPEVDFDTYNQLLACKNYDEYQKIAGEKAALSAEKFNKIHKLQAQTEFNRTDFETVKQFALKSSYDEYRDKLKGNAVDEQTFNHIKQYVLVSRTFDYGEYQKAAKDGAMSVEEYNQIRAAAAPARLPFWRAVGAAVADKRTRKEIIAHSGYFIRSLPFIGQAYGLYGMAKNLVSIRAYKSLGASFKAVGTSVKNLYNKKGRSREDWKNLWINANGLLATGYGFVMAEQSLTSAYNGAVANIQEMQNSDVSAGEHILNTMSAQWNDYKAKWSVNLFGKDVNAAVHNMNRNENISQLDDVVTPAREETNAGNLPEGNDNTVENEAETQVEENSSGDTPAAETKEAEPEPKAEEVKAEEPKAEVKAEEVKAEAKVEEPKAEAQEKETAVEAKVEENKEAQEPKAENPTQNKETTVESKVEPKTEEAKAEEPKVEEAVKEEAVKAEDTQETSTNVENAAAAKEAPASENRPAENTSTNEATAAAVKDGEGKYTVMLDGDRSIDFSFDDKGNIVLSPQVGDGAALADLNEEEARAAILQQMTQLQASGQELPQGAAAFLAANATESAAAEAAAEAAPEAAPADSNSAAETDVAQTADTEIKISENKGKYSMTIGDGEPISFHFSRGDDHNWHMILEPNENNDLSGVDNEAAAKAVYEHFKDEDHLPRPLRKFMADYQELHPSEQAPAAENQNNNETNNNEPNNDIQRTDEIVARGRIKDSYFVTGRYTVADNGQIALRSGYVCHTDPSVLEAIRESNTTSGDELIGLNGYIHSDNSGDRSMQEAEMARRITLTYAAVHDIESKAADGKSITAGEQLAVDNFNNMIHDMGLSVDDSGKWHWTEPEATEANEQQAQNESQPASAENQPEKDEKSDDNNKETANAEPANIEAGVHEMKNLYLNGSYHITEGKEGGFDTNFKGNVHTNPLIASQLRNAMEAEYEKSGYYKVGTVCSTDRDFMLKEMDRQAKELTEITTIAEDINSRRQQGETLTPQENSFLATANCICKRELPGYHAGNFGVESIKTGADKQVLPQMNNKTRD